jgi:acyl-coenzyme A synthetase/AMP-(fatty) acid ligase
VINSHHFEPNDPSEEALHFYNELHQQVGKMANVLREQGLRREICIYLPMIPELAITTLACARIGAIHSVVLQDFQSVYLQELMIANVKWLSHQMDTVVTKPSN